MILHREIVLGTKHLDKGVLVHDKERCVACGVFSSGDSGRPSRNAQKVLTALHPSQPAAKPEEPVWRGARESVVALRDAYRGGSCGWDGGAAANGHGAARVGL